VVLTVTTAFCSSGYWRTLSSEYARRPSSRMNRLTTIASTGLLTKMSVNFISAVPGRGIGLGGRLHLVVDGHLGAVAQAQQAAGHHALARREAVAHGHQVAARLARGHEALAHRQAGPRGVAVPGRGSGGRAVGGRGLLDHVHRVAVGIEA